MPLSLRQLVSGGDQNVQAAVAPVRLSRVFQLMLAELAREGTLEVGEAIRLASAKSGIRRPGTRKQLEEWTGPANWAISCGAIAVPALQAAERAGVGATIFSLRSLPGLMTPQARIEMGQRMLAGVRGQPGFEAACRAVRHEMLVSMHWRSGNPHLDAEKVEDATLRASFSSAAPDAALKFHWKFWRWSAAEPWPKWEDVLKAPLYEDPQYASLRRVLASRIYRAVAAPGGAGVDVRTLRVDCGGDRGEMTLGVYSPRSAGGVPPSSASGWRSTGARCWPGRPTMSPRRSRPAAWSSCGGPPARSEPPGRGSRSWGRRW